MYYCGIDIAKYKHEATVIAESGKALLDSISFSDTFGITSSEYYRSLRAREKHHLAAVGAVFRKLCNTIYTILKEDRRWLPVPPEDKL